MSIRESSRCLFPVAALAIVVAIGAVMTGCVKPPPSYPFVPMQDAIHRVNENNARLAAAAGGLKASPLDATVRFRERPGAPARQFSFPGVLGFHQPRDLILQLREGLGNTMVVQAGSNDTEYWLWVKPEINTLWWGTYPKPEPETAPSTEPTSSSPAVPPPSTQLSASDRAGQRRTDDVPGLHAVPPARPSVLSPRSLEEMPIRPGDLIEVLGVSVLPTDTTGPGGPVYRPEPERNVLIFLEYDEAGQGYIQKEYHLDRAPPYLVREIIFRDPDGRVRMHATLSESKPVQGVNALAAHKIRIEWPSADSWLELRIRRFTFETEPFLSPMNPREQGIRAGREIRVHAAADEEPIEISPGGGT